MHGQVREKKKDTTDQEMGSTQRASNEKGEVGVLCAFNEKGDQDAQSHFIFKINRASLPGFTILRSWS